MGRKRKYKGIQSAAKRQSFTCLICQNQRYFKFVPRPYPLFDALKEQCRDKDSAIVKSVWDTQFFECPFCSSTNASNFASSPTVRSTITQYCGAKDAEDDVKEEEPDPHEILPLPPNAPFGMTVSNFNRYKLDATGVPMYSASRLIKLGYPPDVVFTVLKSHSDISKAETEAEDTMLGRLCQIQMTVSQNESNQLLSLERQCQEDFACASVIGGDIRPCQDVDCETTNSLVSKPFFLLVFQSSKEENLECDSLQDQTTNLRNKIYIWLKTMKRVRHWYSNIAIHYFKIRRSFLLFILDVLELFLKSDHPSTLVPFKILESALRRDLHLIEDCVIGYQSKAALEVPALLRASTSITFPNSVDTIAIFDLLISSDLVKSQNLDKIILWLEDLLAIAPSINVQPSHTADLTDDKAADLSVLVTHIQHKSSSNNIEIVYIS